MRLARLLLFACSLLLVASAGIAQVTTHHLVVGGNGALGCQPHGQNPPLLNEGSEASGTIELRYDAATGVLDLRVTNTSTVVPQVPNPLVSDVALNLPAGAVASAELLAQTSSGGAPPRFGLEVDVAAPPHLQMGCLGTFGLRLHTVGADGSIANANASTFVVPSKLLALGPVDFAIKLIGPGTPYLTASTIAQGLSQGAAPGVNAALRFIAGGPTGMGNGYISNVLPGGVSPSLWITAPPHLATTTQLCFGGRPRAVGTLLASLFPGPTMVGPIELPIGLPLALTLKLPPIPLSGTQCFPVQIPDDPQLVGITIYFTVIYPLVNRPAGQERPEHLEFTPRFDMKILPPVR
jgi:hypothetical protein